METITEVKERPILFSAPMVRAILEGRKTVTRRVVKPQPDDDGLWNDTDRPRSLESTLSGWNGTVDETGESKEFRCPYDANVLWARETWAKVNGEIAYKASKKDYLFAPGETKGIWKPSIHMPKKACRLRLEIQSIRVERLHDITEEDAIREGIHFDEDSGYWFAGDVAMNQTARGCFMELWVHINGVESWNINPWVWRIEFKKL
jgi:hypothetical protein